MNFAYFIKFCIASFLTTFIFLFVSQYLDQCLSHSFGQPTSTGIILNPLKTTKEISFVRQLTHCVYSTIRYMGDTDATTIPVSEKNSALFQHPLFFGVSYSITLLFVFVALFKDTY